MLKETLRKYPENPPPERLKKLVLLSQQIAQAYHELGKDISFESTLPLAKKIYQILQEEPDFLNWARKRKANAAQIIDKLNQLGFKTPSEIDLKEGDFSFLLFYRSERSEAYLGNVKSRTKSLFILEIFPLAYLYPAGKMEIEIPPEEEKKRLLALNSNSLTFIPLANAA